MSDAQVWPTSAEGMLEMMRHRSVEGSPFTSFLRIDLVSCWDGEAELLMAVRPDLTQHRGTVHGGVLASLADNVCGYASASLAGPVVTANFTLHLLAPAVGKAIRAKGRTLRVGKRQVVASADLFAEGSGGPTMVATALATMVRTG